MIVTEHAPVASKARRDPPSPPRCALITPAYNEADLIGATIESVVAQSVRPVRWVIVSDGSSDGTDEIVERHAAEHEWITLLRRPPHEGRQFAAKAHAFNAGLELLKTGEYDAVGNLDADITFEPDYLEFLLGKLAADPQLGVVGTPFVDDHAHPENHSYNHRFAQLEHVSGACQIFRKECFDEIGGYIPIRGGAIDWIAVTTARMKGWKTRTFTDKVCLHHRPLGTGTHGKAMVYWHYGRKAYYVGGHPLWILMRSAFQMRHKPWIVCGVLFLAGAVWAWITRTPRAVSPELMAFHRGEQMARLKAKLGRTKTEAGAPVTPAATRGQSRP
jgi:glycosyltransferase involved in cell wall biosynthesis